MDLKGLDPMLFQSAAEDFGDDNPQISFNRAWFNILRSHRLLHPSITTALKKHGISDPVWYDIILMLERAGTEGHMMSELEGKLHLPQYALSRHVSRMEKAGLLRREYISDGRRKQVLFLTKKSEGLTLQAWPDYVSAIQDAFLGKLSEQEAYVLTRLLIKVQK